MKSTTALAALAFFFAACTDTNDLAQRTPEAPPPTAVSAPVLITQADNIESSDGRIRAEYANGRSSFTLTFTEGQHTIHVQTSKLNETRFCGIWMLGPGVFMAEIDGTHYAKVNTNTGHTLLVWDGVQTHYFNPQP